MCCWHQLPRGLSRRGAITRAAPSWSPGAARQPTRELMSTTHTYPWLIPIITWRWQFPSLSTNILLFKSKLKLESRAIVVGVAMSPRNLGGKYRCPPPAAKVHVPVFSGSQSVSIELHQSGVIACMATTSSITWCVYKLNFCGNLSFPTKIENGEFYTYDIYPNLNRSVCLLMGSPTWWRFTFCSSGISLVFWWRDAPLVREFQMWGRRCKQWDSHWF